MVGLLKTRDSWGRKVSLLVWKSFHPHKPGFSWQWIYRSVLHALRCGGSGPVQELLCSSPERGRYILGVDKTIPSCTSLNVFTLHIRGALRSTGMQDALQMRRCNDPIFLFPLPAFLPLRSRLISSALSWALCWWQRLSAFVLCPWHPVIDWHD